MIHREALQESNLTSRSALPARMLPYTRSLKASVPRLRLSGSRIPALSRQNNTLDLSRLCRRTTPMRGQSNRQRLDSNQRLCCQSNALPTAVDHYGRACNGRRYRRLSYIAKWRTRVLDPAPRRMKPGQALPVRKKGRGFPANLPVQQAPGIEPDSASARSGTRTRSSAWCAPWYTTPSGRKTATRPHR